MRHDDEQDRQRRLPQQVLEHRQRVVRDVVVVTFGGFFHRDYVYSRRVLHPILLNLFKSAYFLNESTQTVLLIHSRESQRFLTPLDRFSRVCATLFFFNRRGRFKSLRFRFELTLLLSCQLMPTIQSPGEDERYVTLL